MTGPVETAPAAGLTPLPPKVAELPRPRTNWRLVALVNLTSIAVHGLLLAACTFIVFDHDLREEIFTTLALSDESPNDPLVVQSFVMPEELIADSVDARDNVFESVVLADRKAAAELDFDDLAPSIKMDDFAPTGPNIKPGDHFAGRTSAAKAALVKQFGGNSASEAAVAAGLKWLASRQLPDGSWSFDHTRCKDCADGGCSQPGSLHEAYNGATALALLSFLGGGHTHQKGDYQKVVKRGLESLLEHAETTLNGLDLCSKVRANEKLYVQGLATIALCETAALTRDKKYAQSATQALKFIAYAQDPDGGGWRYAVHQPGDTSVVGWQIMALKSGQNARLKIPPNVFRRADKFLDHVQAEKGAGYGYASAPQSLASAPPGTTAVGLLCRMYMGWDKKNPNLRKGVAYLDRTKPSTNDIYYNYYATQVMHHWGGDEWSRWNAVMRDHLIRTQIMDGVEAGSWNVTDPHGGAGGRLYQTCLSVMTLEVYYRHLPIYSREKLKVEF